MRVLWFSNIIFPEACSLLSGKGELRSSGGWIVAAANELEKFDDTFLAVVSVTSRVNEFQCVKGDRITYYLIPQIKTRRNYSKTYEHYCKVIQNEFQPDVVHIHGTENAYGLAYINACGSGRVVVSLQGLISVISAFYNYGLTIKDIYSNLTIRDIFKGSLVSHKRKIEKKGKLEISILQKVGHVIGRTSWDKAHVLAINPKLNYHFCNETLRKEFYTGSWNYEKCVPYTIFLSQASYPVKGAHQLFKAMPFILRYFPKTQIRIAGDKTPDSFFQRMIKCSGYNRFLSRLAKQLSISHSITYLGALDGEQMKEEYLKANVFVCPSTIENSPNSLGEAQLLGVPCVCSCVGGTMDMIPSRNCGELYRFEDVEMLAYKICEIFRNSSSFDNTEMRMIASKRHNASINISELRSIYNDIVNQK